MSVWARLGISSYSKWDVKEQGGQVTLHLLLKGGSALFFACLTVTTLLTPVVIRFARKVDAVDRGGYRKVYQGAMPLLGGLGIAIPLIVLALAAGSAGHLIIRNWQYAWTHYRALFDPLLSLAGYRNDCLILATGGVAIVGLGLIDDTKGMRARQKLLGQIVIALFVCLSGYALTAVSIPLMGTVDLGIGGGYLLTVLWVVGLINAFNLIDGIDGLASGIALVGAVALVALGIIQGNVFVTVAGAALAGSLLGFLLYNFPPARIFLGDTGSMFLGYALAMMSLMVARKTEAAVIVLAPMLALSVPIVETLMSILRRFVRGAPIFVGDNRHTHHRLLRKGYSQPRVVLTLCGTGLLLATSAVMSAVIPEHSMWAWSPYALSLVTIVNLAWLAGYLRPSNFHMVVQRRNQNRVFQALSRYASLRLNAGLQSVEMNLLLELCRRELGLRQLEGRMKRGDRLFVSTDGVKSDGTVASPAEMSVKSSDGQDVVIVYEFYHSPDYNRHQDVISCLAGIFDGMRIDHVQRPRRTADAVADEGCPSRVVPFRSSGKYDARE